MVEIYNNSITLSISQEWYMGWKRQGYTSQNWSKG